MNDEYELIIVFKSETPFYKIRSFIVDDLLDNFNNLQMWDFKRKKDGIISKLKKENAMLKENLKPENCLKLLTKEGYVKFTSDSFTKAKEIIKDFLLMAKVEHLENSYETVDEAKQFLSEVEE